MDERHHDPSRPWWETGWSLDAWLLELDAVGVDVDLAALRLKPRTTRPVPAWVCSDFYVLVHFGVLSTAARKAA